MKTQLAEQLTYGFSRTIDASFDDDVAPTLHGRVGFSC